MGEELWLDARDPGVRAAVAALDAAGIETFESCEGGAKGATYMLCSLAALGRPGGTS